MVVIRVVELYIAGVQAALDEINSRDDLLPGYTLHYTLTDSKVLLIIEKYCNL